MIKTFQFSFDELNIRANELEKLMGYKIGSSPEPLPQIYQDALETAMPIVKIEGGYIYLDSVGFLHETKLLVVNGQHFNVGRTIFSELKKSSAGAFFVCTAGNAISDLSKKLMAGGGLLEGYVFDVIGSVVVEKAMDKIQEHLKNEMHQKNLNISNRFSPGYCDWSVAEQQKLFSFFPSEFCGVTLSESSLMNPIKSISGFIGIGKDVKTKGYPCLICPQKNCIYRNKKAS